MFYVLAEGETAAPADVMIKPRLTVPGRGVVTIEEMVLVTAGGAEFLAAPQTELLLID